jgi:hypothetical protein
MNRYINNLRYYSSERREPELREEDVHKPSLFPSDKVQITLLGSILETYIDDDNKIKEFRDTIQSNFESFMFKLGQDQPVRYWFTVHSSEGIKALGKASILYPLTLSPLTMANHIITEFMRVHDQYGGHDQTSSRSEFDMIVVNINWKQYVDEGQLAKIKDEGLLYQFRKAIVLETNSK